MHFGRNPFGIFLSLALAAHAHAQSGPMSTPTVPVGTAASNALAATIAAARVREMESVVRLSAEGKELYNAADSSKRPWADYCRASAALSERGEFRQAVRSASQALFLGLQGGDDEAVGYAKRDLAVAYSYAGNLERAQQYAEEALKHNTRGKSRSEVHSWAYKVLGDVALRQGDTSIAIAHYQHSIDNAFDGLRYYARASMAAAYLAAGQLDKAQSMVESAESYRTEAQKAAGSVTQRIRANIALKAGKFDQAIALAQTAVVQSTNNNDGATYERFWSLETVARARLASGDKAGALKSYLEAIATTEQMRARFHSEEIKTGLFGELQQVFDAAVDLLMQDGKTEAAWAVNERGRSRALLDLVRNRVTLTGGDSVFADPFGAPITAADLSSRLKENEAVVEFYVLPDKTYAWVLRRDGLQGFQLPIKQQALVSSVAAFRDALSTASPKAMELGATLYTMLLQPLGLRSQENLAIVPHGALHYVPFQALRTDNHYLIEEAPISYIPSASALAYLLQHNAQKKGHFLGLGNPDLGDSALALPGAQQEVEVIKAMFPDSEAYYQADATKQRLFQNASKARMVHIAAHADVDALDPLYSRIYLAGPGRTGALEAREVYGMNLKDSALVALSACESGLGKVSRGDEIWGFTRSFLSAGSPTLMVSLWPVADESTKQLMTAFYHAVSEHEAGQSLRTAQLEVMKDPRFAHPYYWAPFNLVGDWR